MVRKAGVRKGRLLGPGAYQPYMQLALQHAARQNDILGYRDDTPKRGDNVTCNKKDSLLNAE